MPSDEAYRTRLEEWREVMGDEVLGKGNVYCNASYLMREEVLDRLVQVRRVPAYRTPEVIDVSFCKQCHISKLKA